MITINFRTPYNLLAISLCLFLFSCKESPETFAIHAPIYPANADTVVYTINKIMGDVSNVKLFEKVATINSSGTVTGATTAIS